MGDDKSRLAALKTSQERHRWHIKKLEQVLRAVDNDALDLSELAVVCETVDMYIETHDDPDCYHDENLYDSLNLADFEVDAQVPRNISDPADDKGAGDVA